MSAQIFTMMLESAGAAGTAEPPPPLDGDILEGVVFGRHVRTEHEVERKAGSFAIRGVGASGVGDAVIEEDHAASRHFHQNFVTFVDHLRTGDVMITVAVALVGKGLQVAAGDQAHAAIGAVGGVHRDPHADAKTRIRRMEIRIIGMPFGAHPMLAGLEENLIEVLDRITAKQGCYRFRDASTPGQTGDEATVDQADRTDLEIERGSRGGRGGAGGSVLGDHDVAQFAVRLQFSDIGLQCDDLRRREKVRDDDETFGVEDVDFSWSERAHARSLPSPQICRQPKRKPLSLKRNAIQITAYDKKPARPEGRAGYCIWASEDYSRKFRVVKSAGLALKPPKRAFNF